MTTNVSPDSAKTAAWPRRQVMARLAEAAGIVLLLAGLVVAYRLVASFRQEVAQQQQEIEQRPALLQQYGAVQQDLRERRHDIERIQAQIITREAVGDFVNSLEEMGRRAQVEVLVTDIVEPTSAEATDEAPAAAGPLQPVRLEVRATGAPAALLHWLHEVEQSPYLASLGDWMLQAAPQGAAQEAALTVPPGSLAPAAAARSVVTADLILMVYAQD